MMSFAMIHSPRVDRVRSRHLGRIRTRKQWQCHQPISLFWMLQQRRRRTECALFALTVSTFPRNANVVERATGAAVIPPTMVKIMTLECHAPLEVKATPSSTARAQQPSASRVAARQGLSAGLARGVLYLASSSSGMEQHEHLRFDISALRKAFTMKLKWRPRKFPLCSSSMMTPTYVRQYKAY